MPGADDAIRIPLSALDASVYASMTRESLVRARKVEIDAPGCEVISYALTTVVKGWALQFKSNSGKLTPEILRVTGEMEPGKVLFFENIFLRQADGTEAVIPWFIVRVK